MTRSHAVHRWAGWAALVATGVLLAGCAVPAKERFYSIASSATIDSKPAAGAKSGEAGYFVQVGPVTVPEQVDRSQLVVRDGQHDVKLLEQHRWAGAPANDVGRALADALDPQLARGISIPYETGQAVVREPDVVLAVAVLRFDSRVGPSVGVDDEIAWSARCRRGAPLQRDGVRAISRSVSETVGDAAGYRALVAAHAEVIRQVARDVAPVLEAIGPRCAAERGAATP